MKISFARSPSATKSTRADTAAAFVFRKTKLSAGAEALDKLCGGALRDYLKTQDKFTGAAGQSVKITLPKGAAYKRVLLLGLDDPAKISSATAEVAGGRLHASLSAIDAHKVDIFMAGTESDEVTATSAAAHIGAGLMLRSYRFDHYKSKKPENGGSHLKSATLIGPGESTARRIFATLDAGARGTFFARDLSNEPPNVLYPDSFAKRVKKELEPLGVKVRIIDDKKMKELGFRTHLAVGQGSARPPCVVIFEWNGLPATSSKKVKPLAFVGKGVTFDTGGISIKPSGGMDEMKHDMSGAAAVAGLFMTLARRKAKVKAVGICGLAENMPDGKAYRPGDIIKSMSGKTVEILNTDAEGRLVLIDSLTYIQRIYDPRLIIDLATLTGAVVVALGHEFAGAFVNDDKLWSQLNDAGTKTGERLWRLPLDATYRKQVESHVADIRNTGTIDRAGGSCTGAAFLQHVIDEGRIWSHLDIAGTAWLKGGSAVSPRDATGFGVRLLDRLVADHYE